MQPVVQSTPPGNVSAEPKTPSPAASRSSWAELLTESRKNPATTPRMPAEKAVAMPSALSLFGGPTVNIGTLPSVSKSGEGSSAETVLSPAMKRKTTDPNLKTVVIDPMYDLTVIVGTPGAKDGQVAFQVNRGSLRHASDVWNKMLTGPWSENMKDRSEVAFPDDSPWAFEQVLRIAHLQAHEVTRMSKVGALRSLAVLADKYNLTRTMRPIFRSSDLLPLCKFEPTWPKKALYQDVAFIALALGYEETYAYLMNEIAVHIQIDAPDGSFYYRLFSNIQITAPNESSYDRLFSSGTNGKIKLSADLPDHMLKQIHHVRNAILDEWTKLCNTAINKAIRAVDEGSSDSCNKADCRATRVGILSSGLQTAGFDPFSNSAKAMCRSVRYYWKGLNNIGAKFKDYRRCDSKDGFAHHSWCSYDKCLGDFGLLTEAKATLSRYLHKEVVSYLMSDKFLKSPAEAVLL